MALTVHLKFMQFRKTYVLVQYVRLPSRSTSARAARINCGLAENIDVN